MGENKLHIRYGGVIAGQEEIDAVTAVLKTQNWSGGQILAEYEEAFAGFAGMPHAAGTNSGTSALLLALACLPPGSRVVMPALQFMTLYTAAIWCRHEPVLIDIDPHTLNLDPAGLRAWLDAGNRADAVAFVHVAGNPAGIAEIAAICAERGMTLIEDCCEALGSASGGQMAGTFGDLAAYSTHGAHHICTGEGGMLLARDPEHAAKAKRIRDWGRQFDPSAGDADHYAFVELGLNLRETNIAGALGLCQLKRLPGFIAVRRANDEYLCEALASLPCEIPLARPGDEPAWWTRPLLCEDRDGLEKAMAAAGVETRRLLGGNAVRQPCAAAAGSPSSWPVADDAWRRGLWLPVHPRLTQDDLETIAGTAREFWGAS